MAHPRKDFVSWKRMLNQEVLVMGRIGDFLRAWDGEHRPDYFEKVEVEGHHKWLALLIGYPIRLIEAAIVENNRRWEDRLRKAGITLPPED